ncbi:MAG: Hsp20/alpha crystallin family protein [Microgenomates group bacterium]
MQLVRFDPFKSLLDDDNWPTARQNGLKIHETETDIIAQAVVAGIPAENVEANIVDGVLTIKAEVKEEDKTKDEFKSSSYQYYYTAALSGGDWQKAEAEVKHGILTVTIPKAEEAKPKKIMIKTK